MELIKKNRSGEYKLEEDETIKIIGYSMGGAYAAGMAYALMQDPEYAHLLQFVIIWLLINQRASLIQMEYWEDSLYHQGIG
jgi:thioesterase domain-containing protein